MILEGEKALKETPEQPPVLKEAGLWMPGGAGFLAIVDLKAVLDGVEVTLKHSGPKGAGRFHEPRYGKGRYRIRLLHGIFH